MQKQINFNDKEREPETTTTRKIHHNSLQSHSNPVTKFSAVDVVTNGLQIAFSHAQVSKAQCLMRRQTNFLLQLTVYFYIFMTRSTVKNSQIQHPQTNNVLFMQNISVCSFQILCPFYKFQLIFTSSEFLESVVKFSVEIMGNNLRSVCANTDIPHTRLTRYIFL